MKNQLVAEILYEIADLLDLKGEIFFKTRAYRQAAQTIEVLDEDIEIVAKEDRLKNIPGIGDALAKKISEIVETGKLEFLDELKQEIPEELLKMLNISGLGPKRVASLYQKLGIKTIDHLRKACNEGKLRNLDGFGELLEQNILRGIQVMEKTSGRALLNTALDDGNNYVNYLKKFEKIKRLSLAGSLRRRKETIGDIDILASSVSPDEVMEFFIAYPEVQRVLLKGSTKTSVVLNDNLQVDLRVVNDKSFGAALQYFTGSKEHNVKMRSIAIKKGYKLNEYGLFDKESENYIVGKNEEEIYRKLGLDYIEPEMRENRGEIEIAAIGELPNLLSYKDIKGDLHVHSNWSDGIETIESIARYCKKIGYEYVAISDHSQSLKIARGLSEDRIIKKIEEIEKINKKISKFKVLCGTECDIKPDGTLDYNNKILEKFDFVCAGIHLNFKMNAEDATKRYVKAMENEHVNCIAHPTCRLMGRREPFDLDMEKIFDSAKETGTYLEINSFPDRLDLNDLHVKQAKEKKVKFVINTDAHNLSHLSFIKFGIATARRGWLEKNDVLNTKSITEIEKMTGK
jgi:DNA polymerase (family 10)